MKMNPILDTADLGLNMDRALGAVRGLRGGAARTLGAILLAIGAAIAPFAWYYDVQPTVGVMEQASGQVLGALPAALAVVAPMLGILLHLLPTLLEVGLPRLAAAGVKVASMLAYAAAVFDAVTDWPRVVETMDAAWPMFASFGSFAGPAWFVCRIGLLALATIGFELALTICIVCGAICLVNSFRKAGP